VAEHNGNDEDEDEDEYGADPTPCSSAELTTTAKEEEGGAGGRGAEGELLEQTVSQSSPTQCRDRSIDTSSVAPSSAAAVHSMSMSTLLALSSAQQPELKLVGENTNNRTSGVAAAADEEEQKKQREREHKKRSKNWTRPETLHLIRLRAHLEPRFAKSGRKTELWDEIAEALQREHISRDAQQCRDKWEKLTAGYKEVRDGAKDREDNPFYDELHPLLSGKPMKRERERDEYVRDRDSVGELAKDLSHELGSEAAGREKDYSDGGKRGEGLKYEEDDEEEEGDARGARARKKKRAQKYMAITDVAAVQYVLETMITRQQKLFRELLESMERKEMVREQMRQEKEEKWQAEERAHRSVFHNAMIVLTQKLVGESIGVGGATATTTTTAAAGIMTTAAAAATTTAPTIMVVGSPEATQGPKRRSKNWKRAEVLQLIKLRGEMEGRFGKSTRHAPLWDELAELLSVQGIKRDGKQCREKWDKLMAEYKDVSGGKRDQRESPYFAELTSILGRFSEAG
jgi:hypothetical protein